MLRLPLTDPGTPDLRSPRRFLTWCARGQTKLLFSASVFGVVWMVSQAVIPLALGAALGAMVRRDRAQIVGWALCVLGLGLLQAAAGIFRHRRAVANFLVCSTRVEQLLARHAVLLGGDLARRVQSGEVANLGASDVERVADALDVVARTVGGAVAYLLVAVVLFVVSPPLGAVIVLGVPLSVAVVAPLLRPFERRQTVERDRRTEASSFAADTVSGLRVLRGLGGERVFINRYERASNDVARASMRTADLQALLDGLQVVLPGAIVVAITWLGARLAVHQQISAGELIAFYASAAFLVIPMQTFVEAASRFTAAIVASRRILGVLTLDRSIADPADVGQDADDRPASEGAFVDDRTGTRIEPGVLTAIVPATPEEGTALLDRLARWMTPDDPLTGSVTWNGRAVESIPLARYRRRVLLVERTPFHLAGKLRVALAPAKTDPTQPSVGEALEAAEATEIVEGLPDGLDTVLTERWRSLSGGQRQRIVLAQALATGAEVLLLDDPTSAVDAHTEVAIARSVARLRKGRTTVICTTSPLVAEQADRVVLLAGRAAATGTHRDLMAESDLYESVVLRGTAS